MLRMAINGSTVVPALRYHDAHAAIAWLERILGFTRGAVYQNANGNVDHAELTLGKGMIMLGSAANKYPHPDRIAHPQDVHGRNTSTMYVVVPDCNPVYARVQAEGVQILDELKTMDYGGQAFSVVDPEGYVWSVGEYDPWAAEASK